MNTLIFFGSLRSKKLLEIVIDRKIDKKDLNNGFINNANLFYVKNETFPYLEINNLSINTVECLVTKNLNQNDLDKIQFFESTEYQLNNINCEVDNRQYKYKYFKLVKPNKTKKKWSFQNWKNQFEEFDCECAKLWMELFNDYKNNPEDAEVFWPEILKKNNLIKK